MNLHPRIQPSASSTQQVYDWLHGRILRGELPPGTQLSETEIATAAGVSRQPVREAFIRLAVTGLAEVRPQRGTFIGRISRAAVYSAQLIREAVETDLLRMVVGDTPAGLIAALETQIAEQRGAAAAKDGETFMDMDDRFHRHLAEAAGHGAVWSELEGLKSQMNRLRYITVREFDLHRTIDQHEQIVDALRLGDGAAAEAAMRKHLRQIRHDLPAILDSHPDYFTD